MTLNGDASNTYEEARKLRLEENKKRFQDLGITKISKSLTELTNSEKKSQLQRTHIAQPKIKFDTEPRRSTRARNPIVNYCDEVQEGMDRLFPRKRSRSNSSSWASYLARPLEDVKTASYKQRASAIKAAEELQKNLKSENPFFVKSMVRSHVYSCFWLGLPSKFCEDHLPKSTEAMELEDEDGNEFDIVYIGGRSGVSGGWRGFALHHKLDDGDALVFELVKPRRFKVYIIRVSMLQGQERSTEMEAKEKLGFKQKKVIALVKPDRDIEDGSEKGIMVNDVACMDGEKITRRSKRLAN